MIPTEYRVAATEVNEILHYTADFEVQKIPLEFRLFLKDIAYKEYKPDIAPHASLAAQKISPMAKDILTMIYCFYWTSDEELSNLKDELKVKVKDVYAELKSIKAPSSDEFEGVNAHKANALEKEAIEANAQKQAEEKKHWFKKLF